MRVRQEELKDTFQKEEFELEERVVEIRRTTKVVAGGKNLHFRVLAVVGDKNGKVGIRIGSAREVPESIRKAIAEAKKNMVQVSIVKGTIPHEVMVKFCSAKIMLKPAAPGTGIVASNAVRAVVELAGVKNILTKNLGSTAPVNVIKATFEGLKSLRSPSQIASKRDLTLREVFHGAGNKG
ncbi:MAG TPA: 30S ribosomal protein S5 [Thermotogota bacterium]|nr:30S ribosomal protein S5 [Thermotogota bacterium]